MLGGWDGTMVVVGGMRRNSPSDAWRFRRWFFLDLSDFGRRCGTRSAEGASSRCSAEEAPVNEEVLALQVDARCWTLAALLMNGSLYGWDLLSGVRLGRWQTNG